MPRYHGLDALRCFAMTMGLVMHAPLVFELPDIVGAENVGVDSELVGGLLLWIHLWRMPTFFILSGFFAQMVLEGKGARHFLTQRLLRIFIPMLLTSLTLSYIWDLHWQQLYHLWFLYYLLIISLMATVLFMMFSKVQYLIHNKGKTYSAICVSLLVALALLTTGAREQGMEAVIPELYSDIELIPLLYYAAWFALGQLLFKQKLLIQLNLSTKHLLVLTALGVFLYCALWYWAESGGMLFISALSLLTSLCWIAALMGGFLSVITSQSKFLSFVLELAYPVYLIHLAPAIVLGAMFYEWGWSAGAMLIPNVILSSLFSVVFYLAIIKFTPLNWFVNGYQKSWLRPLGTYT